MSPFNFEVIVTPVDAPTSARRVSMGLTPQAEFVVVDSVVATPANGAVGTPVSFTARVFNAVNQSRTANGMYRDRNRAGQASFERSAGTVELSQTATLKTFTLATPIDTTNLTEGPYTIEVSLYDTTNSALLNPTPGSGTFFLGPPISGAVSVTPTVLPPQGGVVAGEAADQSRDGADATGDTAGQRGHDEPGAGLCPQREHCLCLRRQGDHDCGCHRSGEPHR